MYYGVAFVLLCGSIYAFNTFLTTVWYQEDSVPTFAQQPDLYKFLLFPVDGTVQIYGDKALSQSIGTLDRAVQANGLEIADGIVVIDRYSDKEGMGYVPYRSLSFLPAANDAKSLQNEKAFVASMYGDLEITWETLQNSLGTYTVRYVFKDHRHVRSTLYTYQTDGKKLLHIEPLIQKSGMLYAALCIYDIPVLLLLLTTIVLFKKRIFRKVYPSTPTTSP